MIEQRRALTISEISRRIAQLVTVDEYLRGVWIVGETVDVRVSGGNCYLTLCEKDADGRVVAQVRACIWQSAFRLIAQRFKAATGQDLRGDMRVMAYVSTTYHPVHGLALSVIDINPAYTLGDAAQRRARMVQRLKDEGIIDLNRSLPWPAAPMRVAIVSARGAAGYGDFVKQMCENKARLRFAMRLFPATMQGDKAPQSIISALQAIAQEADKWDCVAIIRGGGATGDLAAYEDYALAAAIARCPQPVIIGIGHDRDTTLLDYVASLCVKTPTAAAERLISMGTQALAALDERAQRIMLMLTDRLGAHHRQLDIIEGQLPVLATSVADRARAALDSARMALAGVADRRLKPQGAMLDGLEAAMRQASVFAVERARGRLDAIGSVLAALSPEATLRRGYSITRLGGKAVRDASALAAGDCIETVFASGSIISKIIIENNQD